MKVTNRRLESFRNIGSIYLKQSKVKTKVYHAVAKLLKNTSNLYDSYLDAQNEKRWSLAETEDKDKKKVFMMNGDRYVYTPDNQIKLQKELRNLSNECVDINHHFVKEEDIDKDLSVEWAGADGNTYSLSDYEVRNAFEDFVIETKEE